MDPAAAVALTPKPPRERRAAWHHESPGRCPRAAGMCCGVRRAARNAVPGWARDGQRAMWLASARGPRGSYLSLHVRALSLHVKVLVLACKFWNSTTLIPDCDS